MVNCGNMRSHQRTHAHKQTWLEDLIASVLEASSYIHICICTYMHTYTHTLAQGRTYVLTHNRETHVCMYKYVHTCFWKEGGKEEVDSAAFDNIHNSTARIYKLLFTQFAMFRILCFIKCQLRHTLAKYDKITVSSI